MCSEMAPGRVVVDGPDVVDVESAPDSEEFSSGRYWYRYLYGDIF